MQDWIRGREKIEVVLIKVVNRKLAKDLRLVFWLLWDFRAPIDQGSICIIHIIAIDPERARLRLSRFSKKAHALPVGHSANATFFVEPDILKSEFVPIVLMSLSYVRNR